MTAVLLGVFAAFCYAVLDLIARIYATRMGPFRMSMWAMALGGALMTGYFAVKGWPSVGGEGVLISLAMGLAYGLGVGTLFKAYSLGPISLVGPITSGYPVLVLIWGLAHGLSPTALQWLALPPIFGGIYLVARYAPNEGETSTVRKEDFGPLMIYCLLCALSYAVAMVLSQRAAVIAGETETVWISRATAALAVLPFMRSERTLAIRGAWQWGAVAIMGILDAIAVVAIAAAGHQPNKEFAVVAGATYGALGAALAALLLKERVAAPQWGGIAAIVAGVAALAWPA